MLLCRSLCTLDKPFLSARQALKRVSYRGTFPRKAKETLAGIGNFLNWVFWTHGQGLLWPALTSMQGPAGTPVPPTRPLPMLPALGTETGSPERLWLSQLRGPLF